MNVNDLIRKKNVVIIMIYGFAFLVSNTLTAQSWNSFTQIGNAGNESIDGFKTDTNDDLYLCGRFTDELNINGVLLESIGSTDAFLLKMNPDNSPEWVIGGGSISLDESAGIAITSDHIYWAGIYWIEGDFGNLELEAEKSSKSIFLVKCSKDGVVESGISIDGTGTKTIQDIQVDEAGDIYLTGNFSDSLFIKDTMLIAKSANDLFLLKMNADQEVIWVTHAGETGYTVPKRIEVTIEGEIVLAGIYQGSMVIGLDTIKTNTSDDDVFIVRFDQNGNGLWGRKAGGVHEQFCSGLTLDAAGNIYVGGSIVGVMKLSETMIIQSPNLTENLFVLKYAPDGTPLWARSFGGLDPEFVTDLQFNENLLVLSGYFQNTLEIENFSTAIVNGLNTSFLSAFETTAGEPQWVEIIRGDQQVFLNHLTFNNTGDILGAGAFNGTVEFENEDYTTNGFYDLFIGRYNGIFTSTNEIDNLDFSLNIFPNPTTDFLQIETLEDNYEIEIWDTNGRLQWRGKNKKLINISNWIAGIYLVKVRFLDTDRSTTVCIMKI